MPPFAQQPPLLTTPSSSPPPPSSSSSAIITTTTTHLTHHSTAAIMVTPSSSAPSSTNYANASNVAANLASTSNVVSNTTNVVVPPLTPPPPPPPPERTIATGVANLGNTCYMNAALQALAHAPELCHALDAESHVRRCPVALRNERRRRRRLVREMREMRERERERSRQASEAGSESKKNGGGGDGGGDGDGHGEGTSKSAKSTKKEDGKGVVGCSSNESTPEKKKKRRSRDTRERNSRDRNSRDRNSGDEASLDGAGKVDEEDEFCTLCEVERLLGRVHSRPEELIEMMDDPMDEGDSTGKDGNDDSNGGNSKSGKNSGAGGNALDFSDSGNLNLNNINNNVDSGPVVPEAFVSGFMSKVAPWFRRGVQEDSHEFLRLLIDAMQNSCKEARDGKINVKGENSNKKMRRDESEKEGAKSSSSESGKKSGKGGEEEDMEYPFRLFRGTVESNVKCSACRAVSCKIDPIEDIGLDILPIRSNAATVRGGYGSSSRGTTSSRSTSPTSTVLALADVQQALERFISSEHLDSGYKCEKCGKLGKATKTSKLASIPPILTLHLKRFRYGSLPAAGGGNGSGNVGSSSTRSSRSARSMATYDSGGSDYVGPSGSAKIEGHVPFSHILDIKPYLTPELQQSIFKKAFCRLFAVVVHTGKNSHSGHYVAFVCNVSKNEWWKMDDAKVIRSNWEEVKRAEAYMLFYRVMDHPVAKQLKADAESIAAAKAAAAAEAARLIAKEEEEAAAAAAAAAKAAAIAATELEEKSVVTNDDDKNFENVVSPGDPIIEQDTPPAIGKRKCPEFSSGVEWAKANTSLPPEYYPLFQRIEEYIGENIQFRPEFFRYITEECSRMSKGKKIKKIKSLLGKGPSGVYPPDDVQEGAQDIQEGILDLFHQISIMYKSTLNNRKDGNCGGGGLFLLPKIVDEIIAKVAKVEPQAQSVLPTLTIDDELIIPEATESYDGAL